MKLLRGIAALGLGAAAAVLTGCNGAAPFTQVKLPELDRSWSAAAQLDIAGTEAAAEVSRIESGCWEFCFTEPPELSGVVMTVENGSFSARLGELSVDAGDGDITALPQVIADGIDKACTLGQSGFTEEDGVLSASPEACGKSCTVTVDKATGDILSFRCPGMKLAAYFDASSPYTEEIGLIDEE